ncbi:helix-turn-helix domain-containing protein [Amycolatopsis sp. cmx-4-61]|uniref:helix-turn-helix domain-containing protein n=1 Tax=Amycolatopsis sp. cmx-4-61 TaxID=2790937 RepID=UPI00397CFFFD
MLAVLRDTRKSLNLTQDEVAEALDWSKSKLLRIEQGKIGLATTDLKALLLHYGITDRERVDNYVAIVKAGRQRAWWDDYRHTNSPDFVKFLGLETAARVMRQYQFHMLPGLLQTPAYTESLVRAGGGSEELVQRQIGLRQARQQRLENKDQQHHFIVDESVLHRRVTDPRNWLEQLQHLADVAARPSVTLQVLTFKAGWVEGMQSSFVVLELSDEPNDLFLAIERPDGDEFFDDVTGAEKAVDFLKIFDRLGAAASPAEDTARLIEDAIARVEAS